MAWALHNYQLLLWAVGGVSAALHALQQWRVYKANTNLAQRAYFAILFHGVTTKLDALVKSQQPVVGSDAIHAVTTSAVLDALKADPDASRHPAVRAAVAGNPTQVHEDVKREVRRYVARPGAGPKGGS